MKPAGARIVAVLGMHRSGTSLITRALEVLGVSLGDRLMAPSEGNNAKGFFEDVDINELNISLLAAVGSDWNSVRPLGSDDFERLYRDGWVERAIALLRQKCGDAGVFGFKDPRTAKLLPFWQEVFRRGEFEVKYLLALRNPASVADSLAARDGLPRERSYYLWLEHVLNSLNGTIADKPMLANYDDFFSDTDRAMQRMAAGLALEIDPAGMDSFRNGFIDAELRHTLHSVEDLRADARCPALVADVYEALLSVLAGGGRAGAVDLRTLLTRWNAEFDRSRPALCLADSGLRQAVEPGPQAMALELLKAVGRLNPSRLQAGFDRDWYALSYPDVVSAGLDCYRHYSETGVFEGRYPSGDVVQSAQRVLASGPAANEALRPDDMAELRGFLIERERHLTDEVQDLRSKLEAALRRHAEREAEWAQHEQASLESALERHRSELSALNSEAAAREQQLVEKQERAALEVQHLLSAAAARETSHAAALGAAQQAHAEKIAGLVRVMAESEREHQQQVAEARDRIESLLCQGAEAERIARQSENELKTRNTEQLAQLQREREAAEQAWARKFEQAQADMLAEQSRAKAERDALTDELRQSRAALDAVHRSLLWRVMGRFSLAR